MKTRTPFIPDILLEEIGREINDFRTFLSELENRIESGEDISNNISWIETQSPRFLAKLKEINDEQLRSVTVEWTGPFKIDQVLEMTGKDDYGVYQIYGHHIIFGEASLLYIGETNQTFGRRFSGHNHEWLQEEEGVFIHVGRIVSDYDEYDRKQLIKDTEALTIYWHSPPYNSNNIDKYKGRLLEVVNTGEYGKLQREYVSSARYREG